MRSALAQTERDHVVIVIDDGGGLPELPEDPRLRACSLSANTAVVGVVVNIGMRLTRSTYVAFLADDNEWEPNHLEVALKALETGPAGDRPDLVYTALLAELSGRPPDGCALRPVRPPTARPGELRGWQRPGDQAFPGLHCSRIRRPRGIAPREDWELVYRLSRRRRTLHVAVPTVHYQVHRESYWSDWPEDLAFQEPSGSVGAEATSVTKGSFDACRLHRPGVRGHDPPSSTGHGAYPGTLGPARGQAGAGGEPACLRVFCTGRPRTGPNVCIRRCEVPWPCPEVASFGPIWDQMVADLTAAGARVGISSYGGWNDGDRAFGEAVWCLVAHLHPRDCG